MSDTVKRLILATVERKGVVTLDRDALEIVFPGGFQEYGKWAAENSLQTTFDHFEQAFWIGRPERIRVNAVNCVTNSDEFAAIAKSWRDLPSQL